MSTKGIIVIIIIILLIIIGGIAYFMNRNSSDTEESTNTQESLAEETSSENETENIVDDETTEDGKILVVYFSGTGNTEEVASKIAENLDADIFEIVPTEEYTSDDLDWTDSTSRTSREYNDESLREVELKSSTVENWEDYDTVLIGYPIWWGIAAWPVSTFVEANDFTGKTVIPFCTSASSGLGQSGELLEQIANSGTWLEGQRFSSNPSDSDIQDFTDGI